MSQSSPDAQFAEMVGRWCALALRRHAHFVDLYDTGRWQHYYTESQFTAELRKLTQMVERWRKLATDAGGRDTSAAAAEERAARLRRAA
ncbi:MAG TPA: TIGR03809 family protein [Pseudolabrys sp.]|nr:TIGR03809 family protein [Pseudolabrys sp.]